MVFQLSLILLLKGANSSYTSIWRILQNTWEAQHYDSYTTKLYMGFLHPCPSAGLMGQDKNLSWGLKFPYPVQPRLNIKVIFS